MTDSPLVNLGDISKPATVLIEKVAEALGAFAQPRHLVKMAKAQAEADLIKAQSEIEITDLQRRALRRFVEEEGDRQANIEAVTMLALPHVEEKSKPEELQKDWLTNFFDKCRLVSDTDMQQLWGQLLAGEANQPGSVSRRTVSLLGDLTTVDAQLFELLCDFVWFVSEPIPLVFDNSNSIYTSNHITFEFLNHLESLGLIHFAPSAGYRRINVPEVYRVGYGDKVFELTFSAVTSKNTLQTGKVLLTNFGIELYRFCEPEPVDGLIEVARAQWSKFKMREISPEQLEAEKIEYESSISSKEKNGTK